MSGRIAVGVSGTGSNLRALAAAAGRGELGGEIALVFADRGCAGLDWAAGQGIETVLVPDGDDEVLAATLEAVAPDVVVLAGYLRLVGPRVLGAFGGRILNVHPSLLPSFPGLHGARDALAAGVAVTGVTVHLVDAALDAGPIVAQEAVPVLLGDDEASLLARIHPVEHRLLPAAVAALLAGALTAAPGARRAAIDPAAVAARVPQPRRALLSVSDKTGLVELGRGLVARGWELVSTGGSARALREAGLPVTDVAAVTGSPEMLDGRVKTLHPRVHAGLLADRRRADHRETLAAFGIAPFDLVVVNLYPFAAAARRPGITFDELVEEIDIGGPSMVRAAAKNHASVAIVTSPARYGTVLAALDEHGEVPLGLRSALAVEAFRHTASYDARIAAELPGRMHEAGVPLPDEPGLPTSADPYPPSLTISMDKVETLRYGENPHQPAARYRRTDREPRPGDGPFATGEPPLQGKALSYNNVLDASAAAALARLMRGPAVVICKHTNPCGAAERPTLLDAWDAAYAGDPVSAYGGVVAVTGTVDRALAERLTSIFLEVVVAPGFDDGAREVLAAKANLRLVVDSSIDAAADRSGLTPRGLLRVDYLGSLAVRGRSGPRHGARQPPRRPGRVGVHHVAPANRARACRPRPRLAPVPRRGVERDRARPRRDARRPRLGAGVPRGRVPPGRRQGAHVPGRARRSGRSGCGVGRVLPLRRWPDSPARGRRHGDRPAGRLDPRRRGAGAGRACRRGDADHRSPPLPPLSGVPFPIDEALLASARDRLHAHPGLRFVLGGSGTGKSTVARALGRSSGIEVIDMDSRIYGTWGDRWDAVRHPITLAWLHAPNALAWQLALEPDAFLRFHAAATAEALDLLADELLGATETMPTLVDGGFGSLAVVARAMPSSAIVCLALPPGSSKAVWAAEPDRRRFLELVATAPVADPAARFLALDTAMSERFIADARAAGVPVVVRGDGTTVASTTAAVSGILGLE